MTRHPVRRPLQCAALALVLAAPFSHAAESAAERWQVAQERYEACHWREAYALLAGLADDGHAAAARIALLMASHGPRLYGERLEVPSAERREHWLLLQRLPGEATQLAAESGETR